MLPEPNNLEISPERWIGKLALEFSGASRVTRMVHSLHYGPLRVQKAFQESDGSCHVYILHPPGGIVAGDQLMISISAEEDSHAVLTTPAAGKFYRVMDGKHSQIQRNFLKVKSRSLMEWLPQETIYFRGADADLSTEIDLEAEAEFIGWEINCLGRRASGEKFETGSVVQTLSLSKSGKLLHRERFKVEAARDNPVQKNRWSLAGQDVFGTLVAFLPFDEFEYDVLPEKHLEESLENRLMSLLVRDGSAPYWGVTIKSGVLLVRYLGDSSQKCRSGFVDIRFFLLKQFKGIEAVSPRIWAT